MPKREPSARAGLDRTEMAIFVFGVLAIAFIAIARLRSLPQRFYAVHVATPSDPRSPPVR